MTYRSRLYFRRKLFEKHSVKIPFKHESSLINDLVMFGAAYSHTYMGENGIVKTDHIPFNVSPRNFFNDTGLIMPPEPKRSILQMKLLEEEAMRHFPQMDIKARAEYVALSIERANKLTDH